MDVSTTLVLLSVNGEQKTFVHSTVAELAKKLWKDYPTAAQQREFLAILRPELDTLLLYDSYYLGLMNQERKTFNEVHEKLWCQGLYRNKVSLRGKFDSEVDAESLWMLRNDKLILVNDDWTVVETLNNSFYSII